MEAFGLLIAFALTVVLVLINMSFIYPLPISDIGAVRYRTMPLMTYVLIIINSLVFIMWQAPDYYRAFDVLANQREALTLLQLYVDKIWTYGYRAIFMTEGQSIGAFTTFTSMFMHGDLWHLFGNMIFLWTFGRRIEDACGPWRYLLFYLCAGMVANIGAEVLNPANIDIPSVGASGAIAGLMGAFLVLFPRTQIQCLWFLGGLLSVPVRAIRGIEPAFSRNVVLPAWVLLIYFGIRDLLPSLQTITQGDFDGGVSNLAHLMGYLAGLLIMLFVRKDLLMRVVQRRTA